MGESRSSLRRGFRVIAVLAAFSLVAAACGSSSSSSSSGGSSTSGSVANTASAPGITPTSILLGSHQPLTGPAAPGYSEIGPAIEAFFQYVNAHGGIYGRSVTFKYLDDGYNPANTVQVVRKLVLQDNVYAILGGLGTPTHTAVVDFLNQNKVPDIFVASGCNCWNEPKVHPYTYGWQPDYIIEGKVLGAYIKDHFAGMKVGVLYQNDDFGGGGLIGIKQMLPASQIVSAQPYDPTTLTNGLGTQVAALQAAGAQVVVLFTIPAATALALLSMAVLGYHPTTVSSSVSSDPTTLAGLVSNFSKGKDGASALNGLYTLNYLPMSSATSDPWMQLFLKIHSQYDSKEPVDGNMVYGMSMAYYFTLAMRAAGQNPTRQDLINAINSQGATWTGPGLAPLGYSATQHLGFMGSEVVQLNASGGATAVSPVYVTNVQGPVTTHASVEGPVPSWLQ